MQHQVGRVTEVIRYPVKSMAGDRVAEANLEWQGLVGDRLYGFYRLDDASSFPWVTGREMPDLIRYRAMFADPERPRRSGVTVITPTGDRLDLHDPALRAIISEATGTATGLLHSGRGTHDAMPISIATTAAHAAVDSAHGRSLDRRRFRSNVIIDAEIPPAEWVSRRLTFGEGEDRAEVLVTNEIPRCALITVDPDTAKREPRVMRTIAQSFGNAFGVYGAPARRGRIRVGDPVFVTD
ncbi:MOSC domain-containing protein [Sphingosinicella rhizophila]|uniref:MOSC domain-containing protein n=1 Tax=Sphingosinicella rhizophila TaxID=3050082 RepID=A0ABU3QB65_9SPHN|nr:MOSC N-terminal beta barrel domain-containing protein [Sphingosinicella sp. GR2756]MDT9600635.1 MOSC domain-containing protein [Sphingosinicella sp. GR2756]